MSQGYSNTNGNTKVIHTMKDKPKYKYPVQTARADDDVWQEFNEKRQSLDLTWNQYIKHINQLLKK